MSEKAIFFESGDQRGAKRKVATPAPPASLPPPRAAPAAGALWVTWRSGALPSLPMTWISYSPLASDR